MDDELDAVTDGDADLEQTAAVIGADQHRESVEVEDPYRVAVGVDMSVSGIPCFRALARTTGPTASTYLDDLSLSSATKASGAAPARTTTSRR